MNPIHRPQPPVTPPATSPGSAPVGPSSPGPARPFSVGGGGGIGGPAGPSGPGGPYRPNFERIRGRVRDGLARKLDRQQIMHEVVAGEARDTFGPDATPDMVASITQAFRNDPQLAQLLGGLLRAAERGA